MFGDMSDGCGSVGGVLKTSLYGQPIGDIGTIKANKNGIATFDFSVSGLEMMGDDSIIGRSLVLMSQNSILYGKRLACGVIGIV